VPAAAEGSSTLEWRDDEVSSDGGADDDSRGSGDDTGDRDAAGHAGHDADAREETTDAKRLRLAREYLSRITAKAGADTDAAVSEAIAEDVAATDAATGRGRVVQVAELLGFANLAPSTRFLRGHELPATCVDVTADGLVAYSGSKDCSVNRWDLESGTRTRWAGRRRTRADAKAAQERRAAALRKGGASASKAASSGGGALEALARDGMGAAAGSSAGAVALRTGETGRGYGIQGHWAQVLAVAVSADGRRVVTGGRDWLVRVWDSREAKIVRTMRGHAGPVTGLVFDGSGPRVYSCSEDRTLKGWDTETGAFAESLFGHSTQVTAVTRLRPGRVASTGGLDRTVRVWKLEAETQLVFKAPGNAESLDCLAAVHGGKAFVTGGQGGSLHLWNAERKKPVSVAKDPHGAGSWIVSLASLSGTDLVASGSNDGWIRLWRVHQRGAFSDKGAEAPADMSAEDGGHWQTSGLLKEVGRAPAAGFVNGLAFSADGRRLVAAVGCEHRMGRWWRMPKVRAGIVVVDLPPAIASTLRPMDARAKAAAE